MASGTISTSANISGSSFISNVTKTADSDKSYEVTLPVATAESSYAQTTNVECVVTLTGGHGLANGVYDAYWTESSVDKIAVGCTGVVATNDLTLNARVSGDDFPAGDPTDMVVSEQVIINTTIDGDEVQMYAISPIFTDQTETSDVSLDMHDSGSAQIATFRIPANEPAVWWVNGGTTNPLTGNPITHSHASNQSTANAATIQILILEDSTP